MSRWRHVLRRTFASLAAGSLLNLGGCGSPETSPPPAPPTLQELLDTGWVHYQAARYDSAGAVFLRTVAAFDSSAEAWLGRSWTAARRDSLGPADRYARTSLSRRPTWDAQAALAVIAAAAGSDSAALRALQPEVPLTYVFHRDPRLTGRHLGLIRALALYHLRHYPECLEAIRLLDPAIVIDLDSYDFRERLGSALEELRP